MHRSSLFCAVAILFRAVIQHVFLRRERTVPEAPGRQDSPSWTNPIPQSEQ